MLFIGTRFCVMGDWDISTQPQFRLIIRLVPSRIFGTGADPSTSGIMKELQALDLTGLTVLDVGSGSGILAFAVSALGASSVIATDSSKEACSLIQKNARNNTLSPGFEVRHVGKREFAIECDLVLANLGNDRANIEVMEDATAPRMITVVTAQGVLGLEVTCVLAGWRVASRREITGGFVVTLERV